MHRVNLWSQGQAVFGTVAKHGRVDYCESVVKLSHISFCTKSSVANMFYRISCSNITLQICHVKCCKYVFWGVSQICHCHQKARGHRWKARGDTDGKPEGIPMESQRGYRGNYGPPAKLAIDRTEEIMYGDSNN